ncbi:serine protease inhibitor 28Dc isoform X2 [Cylas formicarius]|uniref:serine protease inhibitor 28Dc isoform X2 n=1 Tax=Cylas formicarius TaxID=197179 RepID=UPI002958B842|nr:serine protease inhibitor 28Dc isoform X2 [Cylas formicarius]
MMHWSSLTIIVPTILLEVVLARAQDGNLLYFPNENGGVSQILSERNVVEVIPPNLNLSDIRGTTVYENYVDKIISMAIAKTTLTINNLLIQNPHGDNVVFSPTSIAGALALVLLGANGKTFDELITFLGLASVSPDIASKSQLVHEQFGRMIEKLISKTGFQIGQDVTFASGIFVQTGYVIRPLYLQTAREIYKSEVVSVDYEGDAKNAQGTINSWVSEETNRKIRTILSEAPSTDTKVIITTALYFNAEWENKFFDGFTKRKPFYINGRRAPTNIEADMMVNGGFFPYYKDPNLECEILGFPYKGNSTTMYVVMPFNSDRKKLKDLESKLTVWNLNRLVESTTYSDSLILFPKMKIQSTIDLRRSLQDLGIRSLFDPNEANLALLASQDFKSRTRVGNNTDAESVTDPNENETETQKTIKDRLDISSRIDTAKVAYETLDRIRQLINQQSTSNKYQNPGLYADQIIHKVYMDITETGTEAAAATAVSLTRTGARVTFRVDVPFFFFIWHEETKTIIFWGSVLAPTPNFSTLI